MSRAISMLLCSAHPASCFDLYNPPHYWQVGDWSYKSQYKFVDILSRQHARNVEKERKAARFGKASCWSSKALAIIMVIIKD